MQIAERVAGMPPEEGDLLRRSLKAKGESPLPISPGALFQGGQGARLHGRRGREAVADDGEVLVLLLQQGPQRLVRGHGLPGRLSQGPSHRAVPRGRAQRRRRLLHAARVHRGGQAARDPDPGAGREPQRVSSSRSRERPSASGSPRSRAWPCGRRRRSSRSGRRRASSSRSRISSARVRLRSRSCSP